MIVNQLENGVTEYVMEKAIVRIHPGKLSEEERKVAIENATKKYLKAVLAAKKRKA